MDIQQMVDMMMETRAKERSAYHVTLGDLITALKVSDNPDNKVYTHTGESVSNECDSYRGYYSDLAFEPGKATTVAQMLESAEEALNKEFTGYKGGEYMMTEDTPLWISDYGTTGVAIVDTFDADDKFVLVVKEVD